MAEKGRPKSPVMIEEMRPILNGEGYSLADDAALAFQRLAAGMVPDGARIALSRGIDQDAVRGLREDSDPAERRRALRRVAVRLLCLLALDERVRGSKAIEAEEGRTDDLGEKYEAPHG